MEKKKHTAGTIFVLFCFKCCIGVREMEELGKVDRADGRSAQRATEGLAEGGNEERRCEEKGPLKVKPTRR